MHRFPYGIIYEKSDDEIVIIAMRISIGNLSTGDQEWNRIVMFKNGMRPVHPGDYHSHIDKRPEPNMSPEELLELVIRNKI